MIFGQMIKNLIKSERIKELRNSERMELKKIKNVLRLPIIILLSV